SKENTKIKNTIPLEKIVVIDKP
ncbi:MAG: hypothetical protein K0S93_1783, partial [Nitrososphaeraceae archaeon]|nr:hypothetical protein [Nitrososphaeraceae archaeon]